MTTSNARAYMRVSRKLLAVQITRHVFCLMRVDIAHADVLDVVDAKKALIMFKMINNND